MREEYGSLWFVKHEKEQLTSEVVIAPAFKIMMQRENLAPDIRVVAREDTKFTLSKKIDGFIVRSSLINFPPKSANFFVPAGIVNYHHMLAVSLFLGQRDVHGGNWGVVEEAGKKWAAVIDHGICPPAFFNPFSYFLT